MGEPNTVDSREPRAFIVAACTSALVMATLSFGFCFRGHLSGDHWEHAAVVRAFMDNWRHPRHPLFDLDAPHAFESPYTFVLALLAHLFRREAADIFDLVAPINVVLLYASLFALLQRATTRPFTATTFAIAFSLGAWGLGAWTWSGFFHFEALLEVASYPSTFAAVLVFASLVLTWDLVDARNNRVLLDARARPADWARFAGLTLSLAACFVTHPTTAVVGSVSIGALTVARMRGSFARAAVDTAVVAAAVVAAFFVAAQWPYFSLIDLVTSPDNEKFDHASHVLFLHVPLRTWPAAVCALVTLTRLRRDRRDPFVALLVGAVLLYVAGALAREGLGRSISWVALYAQLGAALVATDLVRRVPALSRARGSVILACVVVVAGFAPGVAINRQDAYAALPWTPTFNIGRGVVRKSKVKNAVVLADKWSSAILPALGDHVIGWAHPVYWVPDADERERDVMRFFARGTKATVQDAIVKKWNVRYLFLDRRAAGETELLKRGNVLADDGRFALVELPKPTKKNASPSAFIGPLPEPVEGPLPSTAAASPTSHAGAASSSARLPAQQLVPPQRRAPAPR